MITPRDRDTGQSECPHVPGMKKVNCGLCLMDADDPFWTPDPTYAAPPAGPRIKAQFHAQYGGPCKKCDMDVAKGDLACSLTTGGIIHHRCAEGYEWE